MTDIVDASGWGKLNLWRHPGGGLAVRPGFRRVYTPAVGEKIVAGFSVRDDFPGGGEVAHYVVTRNTITNAVHLLVLDEMGEIGGDVRARLKAGLTR